MLETPALRCRFLPLFAKTAKKRQSLLSFLAAISYICHRNSGPRSTTDSIGVSEALDSGSIPDAATKIENASQLDVERHFCFKNLLQLNSANSMYLPISKHLNHPSATPSPYAQNILCSLHACPSPFFAHMW